MPVETESDRLSVLNYHAHLPGVLPPPDFTQMPLRDSKPRNNNMGNLMSSPGQVYDVNIPTSILSAENYEHSGLR